MKSRYIISALISLLLVSCKTEPSLQKYFVENAENKNFITLDVSPSILNIDKSKLTADQAAALQSFDKMNILAFKLNDKNKNDFEIERSKVSAILKDKKYQQLMKVGSGKEGVSVSYLGDDQHISEFVLYGVKNDKGFGVVRVLGKDMNPNIIMTMISVLKQSNFDKSQLQPLKDLLN